MRQFKLKSFDDYPIFVTIWDDVENPKAVLQLVHGMTEYADCYDDFAKFMNSKGYIVFADDHRSHGRTETDEDRGRHPGNIFEKTVNDELFFREYLKEQYKLPVFYLGHSYGSFIGQALCQRETDIKAMALVGTGYIPCKATLATILLAPFELVAKNWRPRIVSFFSRRIFRYKNDSGLNQWLCSVKEERNKLDKYPYMVSNVSVNFNFSFMNAARKLYGSKAKARLNPLTSIAIFSGSDDPVGNFGKGIDKLENMYKEVGLNCEKHLYEGSRHNVLFDKDKDKVREDVVNYFDKYIIYHQQSLDDLV